MTATAMTLSPCGRTLFDTHRRLAYKIATRYRTKIPVWVSADDLRQECKIALFRAAHHFDTTRGFVFASYATVIVCRAARAFIRREYRQGFSGIGRSNPMTLAQAATLQFDPNITPELISDSQPDQVIWKQEQWDQILKCLSSRERQVLELRLFANFSNREVGEKLGFGASRVSYLWHSAINRIKQSIPKSVMHHS